MCSLESFKYEGCFIYKFEYDIRAVLYFYPSFILLEDIDEVSNTG